jgi:tetratricopeptide (TPR) repeat protein
VEIVGETGSGKSRLLVEARELRRDMRFVHATCESYTRTIAYVGCRDPLRQLLGLTWEDTDEVVLGVLRAELERSHPELLPWLPLLTIALGTETPSSTREVDELAPDFRAAKLHEVVLRMLEGALAIPTLVEIEHAHLMDEASSALLHALEQVLGSTSRVVIVTRRDLDEGFVAAAASSLRLELCPLRREEALALAEATPEAHVVPPHVLALAVERSGGSPEFLLDLLSAAAATRGSGTLPDSVAAAAEARIDALDPGDRRLVRRAAVLGLSFHPGRLRDVLGADASEPDAGTWQRLSGVFAHDDDGHVRFKRPALREVAYHRLPFRVRRELHAAVARSLERDLGREVDADPAVLSLHLIHAGEFGGAWRYALIGARRAAERFAYADAARLYRRAIEAGRANWANPAELSSTFESLAEALRLTGEPAAASDALTAARGLVPDDRLTHARLMYWHAEICARPGRMLPAVRWVNRALRVLDGDSDEGAARWRVRLMATLAAIRQRQRRPAEAARLARSVIAQAEPLEELQALAHACYMLDWALIELGDTRDAVHSPRALEVYRALGELDKEAVVLNNLGMFAYFRGEWDEAIALYRESAACAIKPGNASFPAFADTNIGEILSDQGRLEEAERHLGRARRVLGATGERQAVAFVDVLRGRLAVRSGRHREGLALLSEAREELVRSGMGANAVFASLVIAEAEAFRGDPRASLEVLSSLRGNRDPYLPMVHRIRGVACWRLDDREAAIDELNESVDAARARGADYDTAAALDALEAVGPTLPERSLERDALLARLGIERMLTAGFEPLVELSA